MHAYRLVGARNRRSDAALTAVQVGEELPDTSIPDGILMQIGGFIT
jgi:hypothetical protein